MEKENNNNEISNGKITTSKSNKKTVLIIGIFIIVLVAVFIIINFPSRKNSNIINNDLSNNDNTQNDTINDSNSNSCKYDTGIKEYDEELYDYYVKEGVCGAPVYLNKEQLENYGFGKKADLNNLDDFTNHVVALLHKNASFDDATQIDDTVLFNLLSQYLNSGNCGWYKKSLYVDAYKYIFGEKEYNINSLLKKHGGYETDNFKQICNGIGSVIDAHLNNKKTEENKVIYEYDARFYPAEQNSDDYTVIVEYIKSGNDYHLNKISIIVKK